MNGKLKFAGVVLHCNCRMLSQNKSWNRLAPRCILRQKEASEHCILINTVGSGIMEICGAGGMGKRRPRKKKQFIVHFAVGALNHTAGVGYPNNPSSTYSFHRLRESIYKAVEGGGNCGKGLLEIRP